MSGDEEESGCGWEWDHRLDDGETVDGVTYYLCLECGAEIIDEEES